MFIFCKVKDEKGRECLIQAWAYPNVIGTMYKCSVHGFVDADGNIYDMYQEELP